MPRFSTNQNQNLYLSARNQSLAVQKCSSQISFSKPGLRQVINSQHTDEIAPGRTYSAYFRRGSVT